MCLKNNKIQFLAIGDITIDAFIKLKNANLNCNLKKENCELCLPFGGKIPYEYLSLIPASGNSTNVAIAVQKIGINSGLVSFIGKDLNGKKCLKSLKENKVSTKYINTQKNKETNCNFILYYENERTILTKHTQFNYSLPKLKKIDYIYLSSLAENSINYHFEILEFLNKNPETKLIFQPGTFQIELGAEKLKEIYKRTEIFFANVEEAQKITNLKEKNILTLAEKIENLGPKIIIISDGTNGAYLYHNNELWHLPIYQNVEVIDKTGAGDAFAAGVVAGLIFNLPPLEAFKWGPINAFGVIQKIGAQNGLLSKKEIEDYLEIAPENYKLNRIN